MGETVWRPRGCIIPEKCIGLINCTIWNNYLVDLPTWEGWVVGGRKLVRLRTAWWVEVGEKRGALPHWEDASRRNKLVSVVNSWTRALISPTQFSKPSYGSISLITSFSRSAQVGRPTTLVQILAAPAFSSRSIAIAIGRNL